MSAEEYPMSCETWGTRPPFSVVIGFQLLSIAVITQACNAFAMAPCCWLFLCSRAVAVSIVLRSIVTLSIVPVNLKGTS